MSIVELRGRDKPSWITENVIIERFFAAKSVNVRRKGCNLVDAVRLDIAVDVALGDECPDSAECCTHLIEVSSGDVLSIGSDKLGKRNPTS
jgi:hypothetical protein